MFLNHLLALILLHLHEYHIVGFPTHHQLTSEKILNLIVYIFREFNAEFCSKQPITLKVSHRVGIILAEARARKIQNLPNQYRFYM